jgi:NTP pyrophosphatase (non-canonical NTP hydrolase)
MTFDEIYAVTKSGEGREGSIYKEGLDAQYDENCLKALDANLEVFSIYYLVDTTTDINRPSFQIRNAFFNTYTGAPVAHEEARAIINKQREDRMTQAIADAANLITKVSHEASLKAGWWHDLKTGELVEPNIGEKLMLIVTEVAEACEGARKNLMDDKLPHRKMIEVELADAVIRIGDLCGRLGLDLGGAIAEKLAYNASREDHKIENRKKENGKRF